MDTTVYYVLLGMSILITLSVHEFFHGYIAYRLGDNTAKLMGRLTINPLKHIDPLGTLCMIFLHFGWAKPVPIDPRNFRKPKRDFAITALAGPVSNILLAILSGFLYLLLFALTKETLILYSTGVLEKDFAYQLIINTINFLGILHSINVGFAIFNLIPIPPLDGSRILYAILPSRIYFKIMQYERYIYWGFIGWLLLGDWISNALLRITFVAANPVLRVFAEVLSLSDIISYLANGLSDGILWLLELIPFLN